MKEDSYYKTFYDEHKKFLREHSESLAGKEPDATEKLRKRPLRFIERRGLECCLWPHLYWKGSLCETVVRLEHEARKAKAASRPHHDQQVAGDSSDDEGDAEADEAHPSFGRIRQHFLRKFFSPVVGYGGDYELLHFVYDLSLWTTIGSKKNVASSFSVPLRLVLKKCPWSPQYWRVKHQAVVDLQRQCGNASLFRTRSPYERTFPYHRWVMDEQQKLGKTRQHLAGAETFHMSHVLRQMDKGFICGTKYDVNKPSRNWQNHVLGCADGSNRPTVQTQVTRLEFQDGKRKLATQDYHGTGRVHSHSLDFLQNLDGIQLEKKISASVPPRETQPLLHGLVMDSQQDYTGSKFEIREEPSVWDKNQGKLLLHHSEADKKLKIRAYFPATMAVTKCHEDIQQGDGNGAMLLYIATYSTKFSSYSGSIALLKKIKRLFVYVYVQGCYACILGAKGSKNPKILH